MLRQIQPSCGDELSSVATIADGGSGVRLSLITRASARRRLIEVASHFFVVAKLDPCVTAILLLDASWLRSLSINCTRCDNNDCSSASTVERRQEISE